MNQDHKSKQACACWGDPLDDAAKTWFSSNTIGDFVIARIRLKDVFTHMDRPLRQYWYFVGHRLDCGHWDIGGDHFKTLAAAMAWSD